MNMCVLKDFLAWQMREVGEVYRENHKLAKYHIGVASGQMDADALLMAKDTDS